MAAEPVLMALGYSYFLSGHGPRHIPKAMEDCGACEGTGRLGPPLMMDDPSRTASVTGRELGGRDEDVTMTPWPDDGERSLAEEGFKRSNTLTDAAAEHARLLAEIAQARARYQDLQANRPDLGDIEACTAHKALEDAASGAVFDAGEAADVHLRENPELVPVYGTARTMLAEGICVIPVGPSKKPDLASWTEFQKRLPTLGELHEWFARERDDRGLADVCGKVSGNLEMLELEGRALNEGVLEEFCGHLAAAGLLETWQRICQGNSEMSPSGGLHVEYRCAEIAGNTKLAARPATADELKANPKAKVRVLIETRGEGGFVIVAPSPGGCHPSGKPWTSLSGGPRAIATISAEEREGIFAAARKCSKMPPGKLHERPAASTVKTGKGKLIPVEGHRPRDVYRRETSWGDILEPAGWALDHELSSGEKRWRRPGKAPGEGHSAVTGNPAYPGDHLFVFSSSTEFEPESPYDRFTAYAVLYHGGDLAAAEKAVQEQGFRDESEILPHPALPLPAARAIARTHYTDDSGTLLLRWHRNDFFRHAGSYWEELPPDAIQGELYRITGAARVFMGEDDGGNPVYGDWNPNKQRIAYLEDALVKEVVRLDHRIEAPEWIEPREWGEEGMPKRLLSVKNGLLDVDTRVMHDHSPCYFNLWALPYAYDEDAPPPRNWLGFLESAFPDDPVSVERLQEWTGYLVSGDASLQKIGLLLGPGRSGKGTISAVWDRLLGERNCLAPTLFGMSDRFGLEGFIGKTLVTIKDASFLGNSANLAIAVEALKTISGGDSISVNRKGRTMWSGHLPARINILANDRPTLSDASGALSTRFYTFILRVSFLDREDEELSAKLAAEIPSILNWALA